MVLGLDVRGCETHCVHVNSSIGGRLANERVVDCTQSTRRRVPVFVGAKTDRPASQPRVSVGDVDGSSKALEIGEVEAGLWEGRLIVAIEGVARRVDDEGRTGQRLEVRKTVHLARAERDKGLGVLVVRWESMVRDAPDPFDVANRVVDAHLLERRPTRTVTDDSQSVLGVRRVGRHESLEVEQHRLAVFLGRQSTDVDEGSAA